MLVSTHNLGSVTTFCDYTVMVKGTVLASGPTDTTLQPRTWSWLLAAYCAMSHLTARKKALLLTMNTLLWHIDRQRCRGSKMNVLLEPFSYEYMLNAMWVSAMVGGLCAFLSCYLMLKAGR